jgi:surfeit locus 1 family protein
LIESNRKHPPISTVPLRYQFQPRLVTTLAAAAAIALTLALANWQVGRAHEKEAVAARLELRAKDPPLWLTAAEVKAQDIEWRRVTARGRFEPAHAVLIDNRVRGGVAGYHVVTPLALEGGNRYVLINRGWVAGTGERSRLPEIRTPAGTVEVTGLAVVPSRRFLELAPAAIEGKVWQNLTLDRYRDAVGIPLQPFVIRQDSSLDDGLVREWDPPDLGVNTHYGYAFQWLALGATVLVIYLVTHVKRRPQE